MHRVFRFKSVGQLLSFSFLSLETLEHGTEKTKQQNPVVIAKIVFFEGISLFKQNREKIGFAQNGSNGHQVTQEDHQF